MIFEPNIIIAFIICICTIIICTFYCKYFWCSNFWNRKRVRNVKPSLWCILKTMFGAHKTSQFDYYTSIYEQLADEEYGGCFKNLKPQLVVRNPKLIRRILSADHFKNRGSTAFDVYDKFTYSLFSMPGNSLWKCVRKNFLPSFSTTKMKLAFEIIDERADTFVRIIEQKVIDGGGEVSIDIEDISVNFAIDTIVSTIFGLKTNCMNKPENCKFKRISSVMFLNNYKQWLRKQIDNYTPFLSQNFSIFRLNIVPDEVRTFFRDLVRNLPETSIFSKQTEEIDLDLMAAQSFIFFAAGFRPVSFLITMAIIELAVHQKFQSKLRDEINTYLHDNQDVISYEQISRLELPFLEKVVKETLRKYPTVPILSRICTQPYQIPDTELTIEKGIEVIIPLAGIHFDEKYFIKPRDFNPERTFPMDYENMTCSYLPFGHGPRQCIAATFSKIAIKTALVRLIKSFNFETTNETIYPIQFDLKKLFTRSSHPIVIKCSRVEFTPGNISNLFTDK